MTGNVVHLAAKRLLQLQAPIGAQHVVAGSGFGDHIAIDVTGGQFRGERLSGTVLPSGGDWLVAAGRLARLDVRLVLTTDDDATLLFGFTGVAAPGEAGPVAQVSGRFHAPPGPYAWLNAVHAVGFGRSVEGQAVYDFYELEWAGVG